MKFCELLEDTHTATEVRSNDPAEIARILERECSIFVDAYRSKRKLILRGILELKGIGVDFAESGIRPDRKPLFMPEKQHKLINDAMISLGLKAHRGNSIFCTTSTHIAQEWGSIYAIFPVNGWVGTIFQKVKYHYVFDEIHDDSDRIVSQYVEGITSYDRAVERMAEVLANLKPRSFNSQADLEIVIGESYDDILFTGKKYYALSLNSNAEPTAKTNDVLSILGI